jgi:NAD(P)-dependent dehydrogenase (short-subunit alcohol dehydrogenase family)
MDVSIKGMSGKVAVITGGGGVLCGVMAQALARQGVKVAVLDLIKDNAVRVVDQIKSQGGQAIAVACDVLNKESVKASLAEVKAALGGVDILINGAGGNKKQATTSPESSFFDLDAEAVKWVFNLNFLGTLLPSQVYGREIIERDGVIINISSMNAFRPLTKIPAYSGAKAAISNFTQWLAVHLSQNYKKTVRVNAIAPGFFLTDQNRFLLTEEKTGKLTARGETIIAHTPMGRFGEPDDLVGTLLWLCSDMSRFVHGVVIPVDGGFSAFSGV